MGTPVLDVRNTRGILVIRGGEKEKAYDRYCRFMSNFVKLITEEGRGMPKKIKKKIKKKFRKKNKNLEAFKLPTTRRLPVNSLDAYAYLLVGEKKIGKTSFSIAGNDVEEFVLQFDKPQLAYNIRETVIEDWNHFMRVLKSLEAAAEDARTFPYTRIVIDGAGEWYSMCQTWACKKLGIDHPSDVGYAKGWHLLRDTFSRAVTRLLALQESVLCGMIFIAHCEWREIRNEGGEKLVSNLPTRCDEILNGKCDGWFLYHYKGEDHILTIRGSEDVECGHRIDGHFQTTDGRQVREIIMGKSASEARTAFVRAFNNDQTYTTLKEVKPKKDKLKKKKKLKKKMSS